MILFYKKDSKSICNSKFSKQIENYSVEFWRPYSLVKIPRGFPFFPFYFWNLFHFLRIFKGRGYGILIIRSNNFVVHHSTVTPSFFRFPDMHKDDLQIGNTFTLESFRGKGLAKVAIANILEYANSCGDCDVWYLVDELNKPSISVIEALGFELVGKGVKKRGIIPFFTDKYVLIKKF